MWAVILLLNALVVYSFALLLWAHRRIDKLEERLGTVQENGTGTQEEG